LPTEVRETARLYLDGKIDQWYSLEDRPGVVFILNMTDTQAAHAVLEELPLGKAQSPPPAARTGCSALTVQLKKLA
jgi:hypothetical protein